MISAAVRATRRIAVTHWVTVLLIGLPSEVRHADEVWTRLSVTALTAIILINFIKICCSAAAREPKIRRVASGANTNSPAAAGRDTARVIKIALNAFLFAPTISPPSARGEIWGTDEAASP